jgi:DNA/RNA endonuclease YhcR with UshA esterase domain
MKRLTIRSLGLAFLILAANALVQAQTGNITAAEAAKHVGERATVCGHVVSTHYAVRSKGSPTFLNLDEPYPRQIFTITIWGSDRPKFGDPEAKYGNKRVCVTGLIKDYRGVPEVIVEQSSQVELQK